MADIYEAIKVLVNQVLSSTEFADIELGEIVSIKPLKIKLSDRLILNQNQLMLTDAVTLKTINLTHKHEESERAELTSPIIVRDGLKKGEKVLLLKAKQGQTYVVISRVVKA